MAIGGSSQNSGGNLLEIENFSLTLQSSDNRILPVLEEIHLAVNYGEAIGIAGESGSGKSLLALSIMGLISKKSIRARSGSIKFHGNNLLDLSEKAFRKFRGKEMAMIFQEPMTAMNPLMSLFDQIAEVVIAHIDKVTEQKVEESVREALRKSGFSDPEKFFESYPHQLSGGMRQRAMLAMALVLEPSLILADEPTTALDAALQVQLLDELRKLIEREKKALIFISHDLGVIRNITSRILILYAGQVMELGGTEEVLEAPQHPYTASLVDALPRLTLEKKLPKSIPGNLPPPDRKPSGCVFSNRCKKVQDKCKQSRPPLFETNGHFYRCFFPIG